MKHKIKSKKKMLDGSMHMFVTNWDEDDYA